MPAAASRRRAAAIAGYVGDQATARVALADPGAEIRAAGLSALARLGALKDDDVACALADRDPGVQRRACELAAQHQVASVASDLVALLSDGPAEVVEAASWALGELGDLLADKRGTISTSSAVTALSQVAAAHPDPLCREASVAALGALGSQEGLTAVLGALSDKPAVRRRAVIALAAFQGPAVDEALSRALSDPDWQVRQAAEDLLGRPRDLPGAGRP